MTREATRLIRYWQDSLVEGQKAEQARREQQENTSAATPLINLLGEILDRTRVPGLVSAFARIKPQKRLFYRTTRSQLSRLARKHVGQFEGSYPLALSQRVALHRFFETPAGECFSVSGPPGTGKTTLLQSIVASLWVSAAVEKNAQPPVILAVGATNQSVTNIIDSFGKANMKADLLSARWLPGVISYGRFCVAERKAEESRDLLLELRDGSGLTQKMETDEYVRLATQHFTACAHKFSGKRLSLKTAVSYLQKQLRKTLRQLHKQIPPALGVTPLIALQEFFSPPQVLTPELLYALDQFDTTLRHKAFLLATHYWEGRWLLETKAKLKQKKYDNATSPRFHGERSDWQRRAMITPAFVSTLFMAPRFFASKRNRNAPPIDLLICDEAGQIPPEVGVVCSALARRIIVVGDTLQLEPMWGVEHDSDVANLKKRKLVSKNIDQDIARLNRAGILASAGNFMALAIHATRRQDNRTIGAFLAEHRRCVPEIVAFCNELAYAGRLISMRPALSKRILPPFGYIHVSGKAEQVGTSRKNIEEIETIVQWLKANQKKLETFYDGLSLSEIVAVITPFAAQNELLQQRLRGNFPDMTIGTVNALQGAERPIVLFSSVYDATYNGTYFFDRGVNMLNVGVSRAKDSFLVFGNTAVFSPEASTPSGLLARYLFAAKSNAIA